MNMIMTTAIPISTEWFASAQPLNINMGCADDRQHIDHGNAMRLGTSCCWPLPSTGPLDEALNQGLSPAAVRVVNAGLLGISRSIQ